MGAAALVFLLLHWRQGTNEREPERLGLDDLTTTTPAAEGELEAVADWLRARLLDGSLEDPPEIADTQPRILFLTLGDGRGPGVVVRAKGEGLAEAAERALAEAMTMDRSLLDRIRLDLVVRVFEPQLVTPRGPLAFERGLDGLAFDSRSGIAFLPDEVVVRTLVNSDNEIRAANIEKYLRRLDSPLARELDRLWAAGDTEVRQFRTRAIFADGDRSLPLYRGHRQLQRADPHGLMAAAEAAGDYLRRAVRDDGSFVYSYLAKTDEEKDDYNMLRHAGTAYSMLELFEETGDTDLLAAAERALDFLRHRIVNCGAGDGRGSCVVEKGFVKLGGNALAILALARHAQATGDLSDLPLMARLARWMTSVQSAEGEFTIHKLELDSGVVDDHISEYYPGEALFALSRLHRLDGDPAWLSAALRGAEWLITERDGDLADDDLSHDHWLLYALNDMTAIPGGNADPILSAHALRLARVIAAAQNRQPEFPDWLGSYYKPPRSTPTATRSEGLCAAFELANRLGRQAEAAKILAAARLGVEFQLQLQFGPESTLFLPDPARALGGLPRSLTNFEIRIDYVQHNLSAFLALRRILLGQAAGASS